MSFSDWAGAVLIGAPEVVSLMLAFLFAWWVGSLLHRRQLRKKGKASFLLTYLSFFVIFFFLTLIFNEAATQFVEQGSGRDAAEIVALAGIVADFPIFLGLLIVEAAWLYWLEHYEVRR